jgi:Rrf2 family protein
MRISRSTGYALLAVGHIARHENERAVLSHDISNRYNIPLEYLLKILQQLVRANVLRSKRGPRGGFSLTKPAHKITVLQIIEAVDGPLNNQLSLAEQIHNSRFGVRTDKVFERAITQARAVFESTKLSSLIA